MSVNTTPSQDAIAQIIHGLKGEIPLSFIQKSLQFRTFLLVQMKFERLFEQSARMAPSVSTEATRRLVGLSNAKRAGSRSIHLAKQMKGFEKLTPEERENVKQKLKESLLNRSGVAPSIVTPSETPKTKNTIQEAKHQPTKRMSGPTIKL